MVRGGSEASEVLHGEFRIGRPPTSHAGKSTMYVGEEWTVQLVETGSEDRATARLGMTKALHAESSIRPSPTDGANQSKSPTIAKMC